MSGLWLLFAIIWVHWLADFVMQPDWVAQNKSSSNSILFRHVATYSLFWLVFFGWEYALVNGVLHFITDYFTSRRTKKLWEQKRVHDFFVVIGLDQAIHLTCLFLTLPFIRLWWL